MFKPLTTIPLSELEARWDRCRHYLQRQTPEAGGLLVFSRVLAYWLSGHFANGAFWLPLEGKPVLLVRKGKERAELESSVQGIASFRSFKDIPAVLSDMGQSLPDTVAVDMSNLSWELGRNLVRKIPDCSFVSGDGTLMRARAVKSDWELSVMGLAGERHDFVLRSRLPERIRPGMSEWAVACITLEEFIAQGHQCINRVMAPGEEFFLGSFAAGDSGNYPTVISGPVGVRGMHPAAPHMGYAGKVWQAGEVLVADTMFFLEGYHTDKTQVYFAGPEEHISGQAAEAFSFCRDLLQALAERLKPGAIPAEIYDFAAGQAEKQGWSEGFMGLGENKVPFVGHGIGLFVDDFPPLAGKFQEPLQENMTLALEPKVALPGIGMVGVEDTFVVGTKGGRSLSGEQRQMICLENELQ